MKPSRRRTLWFGTVAVAVTMAVISFTPLVIPAGQIHPTLGGVPVTLWTGVLIAFTYIAVTYVAGKVHPESTRIDRDDP